MYRILLIVSTENVPIRYNIFIGSLYFSSNGSLCMVPDTEAAYEEVQRTLKVHTKKTEVKFLFITKTNIKLKISLVNIIMGTILLLKKMHFSCSYCRLIYQSIS